MNVKELGSISEQRLGQIFDAEAIKQIGSDPFERLPLT